MERLTALDAGFLEAEDSDDLIFGITADYDATPDVDEMDRGIEQALAELVAPC